MVPAGSSCHGISCSWHLSRSQAETPLILAVQISRATSDFARENGIDLRKPLVILDFSDF
jgi:hypothetical protein